MNINFKHQLFSCIAFGILSCAQSSMADGGTAPNVSPSGEQTAEYSESADSLSFQATGGDAPEPTTAATCPPWVKDGDKLWEWDVSGGIAVDGGTSSDTLKIKRSTAAKGAVKGRFKQKWKDSTPPSSGTPASSETYSPYSTSIDVYIIKVEFNGLGTLGNPSFYDGFKFQTISAWAGSVKVTPKEATGKVNVKFEQWKNTTFTYVKTDSSSHTESPTPGQDITFTDAPTVTNDIINVTGGDNPGPILNYSLISTLSVNFNFNLYLRYEIPDAGVSLRTVGKVTWSWSGSLVHTFTPTEHFTPTGSSTTGSGSASSEAPQAP